MKKLKLIVSLLMIAALLVMAVSCDDEGDPATETVDPSGESNGTVTDDSKTPNEAETSNPASEGNVPSNDAKTIVGKWDCNWDMSGLFNMMFSMMDETMGEYVHIEKLDFPMHFTFGEDGTYTVVSDRDTIKESMSGMVEDLVDGLNQYFEHVIGENEMNMTVEDLLAASGFNSMDEYLDAMMSGFEDTAEAYETSGKWTIEDGKLCILEEEDGVEMKSVYTYELTGNQLKLLDVTVDGEGMEGMEDMLGALMEGMFPMILIRAE